LNIESHSDSHNQHAADAAPQLSLFSFDEESSLCSSSPARGSPQQPQQQQHQPEPQHELTDVFPALTISNQTNTPTAAIDASQSSDSQVLQPGSTSYGDSLKPDATRTPNIVNQLASVSPTCRWLISIYLQQITGEDLSQMSQHFDLLSNIYHLISHRYRALNFLTLEDSIRIFEQITTSSAFLSLLKHRRKRFRPDLYNLLVEELPHQSSENLNNTLNAFVELIRIYDPTFEAQHTLFDEEELDYFNDESDNPSSFDSADFNDEDFGDYDTHSNEKPFTFSTKQQQRQVKVISKYDSSPSSRSSSSTCTPPQINKTTPSQQTFQQNKT
jgi:hypothetical protein